MVPAVRRSIELLLVQMFIRIDMLVHEGIEPDKQVLRLLIIVEIHPVPRSS